MIKTLRTAVCLVLCLFFWSSNAQVVLRDTLISWQHHDFVLGDDQAMLGYTTNDDEITEVAFNGKVLENELIRLVLIPEYGGRVLSYVYKPTGYEYLYQAECGSPYGMKDGNFYYDWLMVYGGIFPTFTEPEHGKAWLIPWTFEVTEETDDVVSIKMAQKDTIGFSGAPGKFDNGVTNITCEVTISVYKSSSAWDFDVNLINNNSFSQKYEYWTCTTLTPGSEIGKTASPLASKIVAPVEEYRAGWSPNSWIGNWGSSNSFSDIDVLDEWSDMGIAYADEILDNYWGVINQENQEGIMRISPNEETPGLKLWTWGRGNVDNDLFDFSNGGADNYIELWAGASMEFFQDATLASGSSKSWRETYAATTSMTDIKGINELAGANFYWNDEDQALNFEVNVFSSELNPKVVVTLNGDQTIYEEQLDFDPMGYVESIFLDEVTARVAGNYLVNVSIYNEQSELVLEIEDDVFINNSGPLEVSAISEMVVYSKEPGEVSVELTGSNGILQIVDIQGRVVSKANVTQKDMDIKVPTSGLYIVTYESEDQITSRKVIVK